MLKLMLPAMLSAGFVIPIADGPPTLAVEAGCRETARLDPLQQVTVETCLQQEHDAQQALVKSWDTFSAADRSHCRGLTTAGGMPSYVELLTCLEISRDARQLQKQEPATKGVGGVQDISRER
jgi:hypothetical protein